MPLFHGKIKDLSFKAEKTDWIDFLEKNDGKKVWIEVGFETGQRTPTQNSSLHKGFELIAKALNEAGFDMKKVLKQEVDIPWTKESVKEFLWKPIQKVMTTKKSTTELDKTKEIDEIWEVLMRHLGEKNYIEYIPFPSKVKEEFYVEVAYPENTNNITAF